jgi:hypothetical protein
MTTDTLHPPAQCPSGQTIVIIVAALAWSQQPGASPGTTAWSRIDTVSPTIRTNVP